MVTSTAQTVLAVDDDEATRYSLARRLRGAGFRVLEAATGAEALRLAREEPVLITLDINLPDMDGFEVCRRLKSDPATREIPVLHLSAACVSSATRCVDWRAALTPIFPSPSISRNSWPP